MPRRVLVTRPEPGASRTARRLQSLGYEPVVVPLSHVETVPIAPPDPTAFDAIAVTSANALRALDPQIVQSLIQRRLFCVGKATAEEARQVGFGEVFIGAGTGAGLATLVACTLPAGGKLLYLCGAPRDEDFEGALAEAGILVEPVEVYRMAETATAAAEETLSGQPAIDAALVYSAEGARHLCALATTPTGRQLFANTRVLALSEKCAAAMGDAFENRLQVADMPDEDSLFALLKRGD